MKNDLIRDPKPPPFPVGTRLVCVSDRGDVHARFSALPDSESVRIYGKGIEVVIDQVKLGRKGTGQQLRDHDGPMFHDDGDPILDETKDGMSIYHVGPENNRQGRLIRDENKREWRIVPTKAPLTVGDTYGDILSWRWDYSERRFTTEHHEHVIHIRFHKVGGRYSRTLPDGTPNPSSPKSYWTTEIDGDRSLIKFDTADQAKLAAVAEYKRRFG